MTTNNKRQTPETKKIKEALTIRLPGLSKDFPPFAYRYNPVSIRVRVVSDQFKGKTRGQREDIVLPIIRNLPKRIQQDITVLLLLSPEELDDSLMNLEFENPSRSLL